LSFAAALEAVRAAPFDDERLAALAALSLETEDEEAALPFLHAGAARARSDARLWQWTGLLHRALDDRVQALAAFEAAVAAAPSHPKIAHGLARVRLEAGLPALEQYARAQALAPNDGDVVLGFIAAGFAAGQGEQALGVLDGVLARSPLWFAGQRERINLAWMLGRGMASFDPLRTAADTHPGEPGLRALGVQALTDAGRFEEALQWLRAGRERGDDTAPSLDEAILLSELGQAREADAVFASLGAPRNPRFALHLVRHRLRNDRLDDALALLDDWLPRPGNEALWPYADTVWRLAGDPRHAWLDQGGALVRVVDLDALNADLAGLIALLRRLHLAKSEHLDQSVRGGTQTDGALLGRIDPPVRALRALLVDAVSDYVAALPPVDPGHPALRHRRDRTPRFSGSWSVRLRDKGFHANHVHPAGWISSALYVVLPQRQPGEPDDAGWLAFGIPQAELGIALPPSRKVEPVVARLVLFPSTTWHGTLPFEAGERMTVAFDVKPPA
jgi:thioredoxin-like negative regulator of GroEL